MSEMQKTTEIGRIEQEATERLPGRTGGPVRRGYAVTARKDGEKAVYVTHGAERNDNDTVVAVAPAAPDALELRIENLAADRHVTAALVHLALINYVKAGKDMDVIALVPRSLENPEADISADPLLVEALGMTGMSAFTRDDELIYTGSAFEMVGNAAQSLREARPPLYIQNL